ncbi:hypothetical protein L596_015312 [Steinernema carpocapsae]|uniref:Uncharacterized protein n=1 Tax=Steinernema carpocapsae TaxID=34508 RepID=A0A4V6A330_STECR|nr:hypothetical protein L596_015312 [Steinernema carpocapsae]
MRIFSLLLVVALVATASCQYVDNYLGPQDQELGFLENSMSVPGSPKIWQKKRFFVPSRFRPISKRARYPSYFQLPSFLKWNPGGI